MKGLSSLHLVDLDTKNPPKFCGMDGSGLGQFCCKEQSGEPSPQSPKFPEKESEQARPCLDHHPLCSKWKDAHPDSCSDHTHPSYEFMNAACMESCGTCKDKVGVLEIYFFK